MGIGMGKGRLLTVPIKFILDIWKNKLLMVII